MIAILLLGFLAVSIFDAIGAILSRVLKFNYALLTFGSILIYGLVAYYTAESSVAVTGILSSGVVGVFDGTVGLLISKKLNANIPKIEGVDLNISLKMVFTMFIFGSFIGILTTLLFN
ncbi:hypothetical protein [Olleya sp. Bg11-27]|uniref:hypothetical protein n=1 Tax=Olleya sp. Bg11-27 TaxID=2058135 RepID=UPI000C307442|nr:hypothetical protein [Olleya sp. Bg11-27]AUC75344.1 hypothetical protein CW732_06490 [Olleya sp. Bg11-27]